MNSGFADAVGAAEAIKEALEACTEGNAAEAIARCAHDRRQAGERNRCAAGTALAHMQAGTPIRRMKRRLAAFAARCGRRAGAWLDAGPYGPRSTQGRTPTF